MDKYKKYINSDEFINKVLDYINSDELQKMIGTTIFKDNKECERAIIHGMVWAAGLVCRCKDYKVVQDDSNNNHAIIVETNLSIDNDNNITDHQSRIIFCDTDWETYCKNYVQYTGNPIHYRSTMPGNTLPKNNKISNLKFDNIHLSCDIISKHFTTKHLAYLITSQVNGYAININPSDKITENISR